MDTDALLADVREENQTALSRLGSSKSLYALTGGEMERDAVLVVAADVSHTAAAAFEAIATEASSDDATAVLAEFEEREAGRAMALGDMVADAPEREAEPFVSSLSAFAEAADVTDADRLGAALGYALVAKKIAEQSTGFFTGEADPRTASEFRSYGNDLDEHRDAILEGLESVADDGEAAAEAASTVIQHAYDVYTARLEEMGVNPKPVC